MTEHCHTAACQIKALVRLLLGAALGVGSAAGLLTAREDANRRRGALRPASLPHSHTCRRYYSHRLPLFTPMPHFSPPHSLTATLTLCLLPAGNDLVHQRLLLLCKEASLDEVALRVACSPLVLQQQALGQVGSEVLGARLQGRRGRGRRGARISEGGDRRQSSSVSANSHKTDGQGCGR